MKRRRNRLFSLLDGSIDYLVALLFLLMTVVGGLQVFNRFVLNSSLSWSEEFQKFAHIWIVYLSLAVGYRRGAHISMRVIVDKLPDRLQYLLRLFNDLLWLILALSLVYYTWVIMQVARFQTAPGLGLHMHYIYFGLLAGGCYLAFCVTRNLLGRLFSSSVSGGA